MKNQLRIVMICGLSAVARTVQNCPSLITWRLIETKMCWGVIFLLGGGFALAAASQKSGQHVFSTASVEVYNLVSVEEMPVLH
jgi:hypothetical protein